MSDLRLNTAFQIKWDLEGAIPVEAPTGMRIFFLCNLNDFDISTGTMIVLHGDLVHYRLVS